jgi:hypothetical protein
VELVLIPANAFISELLTVPVFIVEVLILPLHVTERNEEL